MTSGSSGRATEQGCRRAMWPVAMILAALGGLMAGPVLWAVLSAAILIVLVAGAIIASAGHSPGAGSFDFSSEWHDLFVGGIVYAALVGAVGGALSVASARSFVRWCKWRRELQPLFRPIQLCGLGFCCRGSSRWCSRSIFCCVWSICSWCCADSSAGFPTSLRP